MSKSPSPSCSWPVSYLWDQDSRFKKLTHLVAFDKFALVVLCLALHILEVVPHPPVLDFAHGFWCKNLNLVIAG